MNSQQLLKTRAAEELLRRRKIRNDFVEFCRLVGYEPAPHHIYLAAKLSETINNPKTLLVFMPPGSAKSTYSSMLFPTWYLCQENSGNILAASHSNELAERFGRKVRGYVKEFGTVLGYGLSADSSAAGRWETTTGREYYAAGVGVGIAGFRAKLGIIDDPIRNRQDAESKLIRDRIWDWFNDDFTTRLVPGSSTAIIMTRWHEDDLAGRLIERSKITGENLDIISFPAIAENDDILGRKTGEWLWNDEYGYSEKLKTLHSTFDARTWASLYQQRPSPETGDYFKREWIQFVDQIPDLTSLSIYGASDYAVTSQGGDYTVHIVCGVDHEDNLYLIDVWRGQTSSDQWVSAWCDLVLKYNPVYWAEEQGQIRSGIGPFREKISVSRRAFTTLEAFPTRGDKAVRAQSIRGFMSLKGLRISKYSQWAEPFINELLSFPAGKHDDQVDALGLMGQLLDKVYTSPIEHRNTQPAKPFDSYMTRDDDQSWRL